MHAARVTCYVWVPSLRIMGSASIDVLVRHNVIRDVIFDRVEPVDDHGQLDLL